MRLPATGVQRNVAGAPDPAFLRRIGLKKKSSAAQRRERGAGTDDWRSVAGWRRRRPAQQSGNRQVRPCFTPHGALSCPIWEKAGKMVNNYDAQAIAEVMGLAFLRGPEDRTPLAAPSRRAAKGSSKPLADAPEGSFVIHVDGAAMSVVEIKPSNTFAAFNPSGTVSSPPSTFDARHVLSPSAVHIEKAVERGLPRQALRHVAEALAGGDKAKASILEWGVVPKTTLERRETHLSLQESERTERVARLFVHARRALGTEAEAREFMTAPHPELDGRSPVDAAKTDLGTRRTEQVLNALEYGLAL